MGPHNDADEEEWNGFREEAQSPYAPYRDDSDESEELLQPDAPLRPSVELGHEGQQHHTHTWTSRITAHIPPRIQKAWHATVQWTKGPQPPRIYTITPIFPKLQHFPLNLLERYAPTKTRKFWLLMALYATWLFSFSIIMWQSSLAGEIPGYGTPFKLSCEARYWSDGNKCGVNGNACRPFSNSTFAFRCPADCDRAQIFNPHAVGDQEVVYQAIVVGGPTNSTTGFEDEIVNNAIYRSDSFICASAIHAGFFPASLGGCGALKLTGTQGPFVESTHHSITSTPFPSYFPHTFAFLKDTLTSCTDLRWPALGITVTFTVLLSLFTTSPAVFFWSLFTTVYLHVALASDPPNRPTFPSLLSAALGGFLPAAFCACVTYRFTVRRSLEGLTAQIEKTILYLFPFWLGALNNYTFDRLPIQRLTPHDIKAQPGAIPALIAVILSIFCIALGQAWFFRIEGRMPRYLAIYGIFVGSLLFLLTLPGLSLRIHHYILALLLLPGTSFQNRPSLIYQGLLLGLFINGIARWGFDSIVQTPGELLEGAQLGSLLPAVSVLSSNLHNITFNLGRLPIWDPKVENLWDGISVLVNDVERYRTFQEDWTGKNVTWTWWRGGTGVKEQDRLEIWDGEVLPEFFRFGYMAGSSAGDFTKAGRWEVQGGWREMEGGPS